MNIIKLLFIFSCVINTVQLGAMTKKEDKSSDQIVLAKTCASAQQQHPAHEQAIAVWCKDIAKNLTAVKDKPAALYRALEEIFIAAGQEAVRNHFITPAFVAQCIQELGIDVTQLIYIKIPGGSAYGGSLLKKAELIGDAEMIETLKLALKL